MSYTASWLGLSCPYLSDLSSLGEHLQLQKQVSKAVHTQHTDTQTQGTHTDTRTHTHTYRRTDTHTHTRMHDQCTFTKTQAVQKGRQQASHKSTNPVQTYEPIAICRMYVCSPPNKMLLCCSRHGLGASKVIINVGMHAGMHACMRVHIYICIYMIYVCMYVCVYSPIAFFTHHAIDLCLFISLSIYLSGYLSIYLPTYVSI